MRRPLVAGNWKMNGSRESIEALLDGIKSGLGRVTAIEVVVGAPAIYLSDLQCQLQGTAVAWSGQDLSAEAPGAYTGEIAASMLLDFGCKYVIVGHSERRAYHGESDQLVAKKYAAARAAGLVPILCIGETLEEREQGITEKVVARQLNAVIELEGIAALADGVVAYEPVWAIGTGKTATPEQAQDVHAFIRGIVADKDAVVADGLRILYGGSMKPDNAIELIAKQDIDGGLIGGASLKAEDFLAICSAAN
ncbi:triose-phosphate isomerase [Candidatus Vondammii sp. HM_W22]|uniref:triose-phosphate isomerase n=1 Tax=Candidatus Vondammii sp. HM_W22 TaxID=2687299 RepID=UPI001F138201|nr:triose-phosphate isomerase [Candidatus Vondammii sp. HM_W22]